MAHPTLRWFKRKLFPKGVAWRLALLSDIHANLEALNAVGEDIRSQGNIDEIGCLGDTVGYGPNPVECLHLIMQNCDWCIRGNHDAAVLQQPDRWTDHALKALNWTILRIANHTDRKERRAAAKFLNELPGSRQDGEIIYVHGSPRDVLNEYVYPGHAADSEMMQDMFRRIPWVSFQGHTHIPGVFRAIPTRKWDFEFIPGRPLASRYGKKFLIERGTKAMINVGSVGQPRDEIPHACYLIVEFLNNGNLQLEWRSVRYRYEDTIDKLCSYPELLGTHPERLREGR